MNEKAWVVKVDRDIEGLIPEYLKNRFDEIGCLRDALSEGDFEQLRQRGHRMKGVGTPYGFDKVTVLGKQIEDAAKAESRSEIAKLIGEYADYLSRITVVYE